MKTCLHRILGHCPNCQEDVDTSHHPNNLECPMYHPVSLTIGWAEEVLDDSVSDSADANKKASSPPVLGGNGIQ